MRFSLKRCHILGWIILSFLVFSPRETFSQQNNLKRISLKWSSFNKVNNNNRPYIAYTAHKVMYKYRATQTGKQLSLKFEVGVTLDSSKTVLDINKLKSLDAAAKKVLLNHEQGHSDLAILYGRILYNRLSRGNYSLSNFKKEVKSVYDALMKELTQHHIRYDLETEHGHYTEQQDKWDAYLKKQLDQNP